MGKKFFSFPNPPERAKAHFDTYFKGNRGFSGGGGELGQEVYNFPPSSVKLKNSPALRLPHYTPSWCGQGQLSFM